MCCNLIRAEVEWLVLSSEFDDSCSTISKILDENVTNSNSSEECFDFGKGISGTLFDNHIDASWVCHASVNIASMT